MGAPYTKQKARKKSGKNREAEISWDSALVAWAGPPAPCELPCAGAYQSVSGYPPPPWITGAELQGGKSFFPISMFTKGGAGPDPKTDVVSLRGWCGTQVGHGRDAGQDAGETCLTTLSFLQIS